MADNRNSRDLAITPGRFALVLDRTKGHVETLTGPYKSSLADTQAPVRFSPDAKSGYLECDSPQDAVQPYVTAGQGQYVILSNPSKDGSDKSYPPEGKGEQPPPLQIGNVVNIPGPVSFALWWQQRVEVVDGHQLRSNQYVVVEVANEAQAKENWAKAVFKTAADASQDKVSSIANLDHNKFTMGQRIIIRGDEISFFIPPTGLRVVKDPKTCQYVREAVTLESQQYCVLLNEDGNKRYVQGPDVVFPIATETFVEGRDGHKIFKCIELSPTSGIHVMVIADYTEGDAVIKAGVELFITGAETPIYYPRPEHAIIKYDGENFIHYATAVPEGEGRYVLNKLNGSVKTLAGPTMALLNPTKQVFIRRVLSAKQAELYFPGNTAVIAANAGMAGNSASVDFMSSAMYSADMSASDAPRARSFASVSTSLSADTVTRKSSYTQPRTLTLDSKYSGAIPIAIWPGYAVQVVKKNGENRVEVGPKTVLLGYDEDLTRLALSTNKPKTADRLFETVYLKTSGNQVSDIVRVETADGVEVEIKLILQVQFEGDSSKWFTVDNYVKQITDHVRSLLRGTAKLHPIDRFVLDNVAIIRDSVVGTKDGDKGRPGCFFDVNGVRINDVEVLYIKVVDAVVADQIRKAQQ